MAHAALGCTVDVPTIHGSSKLEIPAGVQSGDRFQPFGMKGSRLLSDYLTDCKRTVFEKRRQQVVCDAEGRIIWLIGERTDQRFAVGTSTRRLLRIWVHVE